MKLALLLTWLSLQESPASGGHEPHAPAPGPRAAVAGLAGLRSRSVLDFGGARNRFEALYVFPDRARWVFESPDQDSRLTIYRSGTQLFQVANGPSTAVEDAGRDHVLLQMELRRAAFLWPHGFEWEGREDGRHAALFATTCCRLQPIGELVATGIEDGRPRRIEVHGAGGEPLEAMEIEAWMEQDGASWPARLRVSGRSGSFTETVEEIDTRARYLDQAFLPGDRRKRPAEGPPLLSGSVIPSVSARFELPRGLAWSEARARAEALLGSLRERLAPRGLELDPTASFEVDAQGRPTACRARLRTAVDEVPEGFTRSEGGEGLFLFLARPDEITATAMETLRRSVPEDATAGTPYVRFHGQRIEVVLPLEPR